MIAILIGEPPVPRYCLTLHLDEWAGGRPSLW